MPETAERERLLAYVVAKSNLRPSAAELRQFLQEQLPEYMVPADFIVLDEWPRTANGKIDLQALSSPPEAPAESKAVYQPPQNELEQLIAGLWQEVLFVEAIDRDDNFFDLGGHSLLAIQFITRVRQTWQVELPVRALFKSPTVAGVAETITQLQSNNEKVNVPAIMPIARESRRARWNELRENIR